MCKPQQLDFNCSNKRGFIWHYSDEIHVIFEQQHPLAGLTYYCLVYVTICSRPEQVLKWRITWFKRLKPYFRQSTTKKENAVICSSGCKIYVVWIESRSFVQAKITLCIKYWFRLQMKVKWLHSRWSYFWHHYLITEAGDSKQLHMTSWDP